MGFVLILEWRRPANQTHKSHLRANVAACANLPDQGVPILDPSQSNARISRYSEP
jgi:hypothetical protein